MKKFEYMIVILSAALAEYARGSSGFNAATAMVPLLTVIFKPLATAIAPVKDVVTAEFWASQAFRELFFNFFR